MAQFTKQKLSASTDGLPVKVDEETVIHTAVAGTDNYDEVWLWASNSDDEEVNLTIILDNEEIKLAVAGGEGLKLVIPGLVIQNSKVVKATAGKEDTITISGFINRIEE